MLLVLFATLLASTGAAKADPVELTITKARIGFSKKAGRDSIRLSMAFDPDLLSPDIAPHEGSLSVTIRSEAVISLPDATNRGKWRMKEQKGIYTYRHRRTKDHADSLALKIDVLKGVMKLRADRLDLSGIRADGPEELEFTLTLSGATCTKTVTMGQKDLRWRFRHSTKGTVDPKGVPGGGNGGPAPDPDPTSLPDISWQELTWGYGTQITVAGQAIAKTQSSYETLWKSSVGAVTPPTVDFTKKMVVAIFLGYLPMGKVEIITVKREASGIRVTYRVVPDTRRYFAPVPPYPHYLFEMTRTDERITFTRVP
jgi:hypothetical protein